MDGNIASISRQFLTSRQWFPSLTDERSSKFQEKSSKFQVLRTGTTDHVGPGEECSRKRELKGSEVLTANRAC